MKAKRNFSRFYAIARAQGIDLAEAKEALVLQFTDGRSSSLRDMTDAEYDEMCDAMQYGHHREQESQAVIDRRRKARSAVLNRMQRLGVDTTDFNKVDAFCKNPRIAGKTFREISIEELEALVPKLEAIARKPKKQQEPKEEVPQAYQYMMLFHQKSNQIYS